MSGLFGETKQLSTSNKATTGLNNDLVGFLRNLGFGERLDAPIDINSAEMAPYRDLFAQQNALNFAQAKESAGNLTGSGFGSYLGNAMQRANVEQGGFLANLAEQRRQNDRAAWMNLLGLGFQSGGVQNVYQPGLFDYLAQGASSLASGYGMKLGMGGK